MKIIWRTKPKRNVLRKAVKHKYTKVKLLVDTNQGVSRIYVKSKLMKMFDTFSSSQIRKRVFKILDEKLVR